MGVGAGGKFSSRRNFFFSVTKFLVWLFWGLIACMNYFAFSFPLREYFFGASSALPRPPLQKFSNGPSLKWGIS